MSKCLLFFWVLKLSESADQIMFHIYDLKYSNFHRFFVFLIFANNLIILRLLILISRWNIPRMFLKLSESVRNYNHFSKNISFRIVSSLSMVNRINLVIKYFSLLTHRLLTQFDLIWTPNVVLTRFDFETPQQRHELKFASKLLGFWFFI